RAILAFFILVTIILRAWSKTSLQRQNFERGSTITSSGVKAAAVLRTRSWLLKVNFDPKLQRHNVSMQSIYDGTLEETLKNY
ncbi:unnamed protein product, partial [Gulo gulo]